MQAPKTYRETDRRPDTSGYAVFAAGDAGSAHVMAHEMLDSGQFDQGHRLLGAWLRGRSGRGSDWVHLQWHMAVFELALGHWDSAYARFQEHILPVAATTEDALTDAPAMLWRLSLSAPRPVELPWEPVRSTALKSLWRGGAPYVELHGLLALAGAGDVEGLDRWIRRRPKLAASRSATLVERMALGFRAFAAGDFDQASLLFAAVVPNVSEIGGSRAQNELFSEIERVCRARPATRAA
jgi:hypothetical protein